MKRLIPFVISIFVLAFCALGMGKNRVPLSQIINQANTTYKIEKVYDLMGERFEVPENCTLVFGKKGKLVNGELVGNETKIQCMKRCLGVRVSGTWVTEEICDEWFDADMLNDIDILASINNMQSDKINQVIRMNKPVYVFRIEEEGGSGFVVSSNTKVLLNTTLKLLTNNLATYQIIGINKKKNIQIIGGQIEGDALEHSDIYEKRSEWGTGIDVTSGEDISIENVTIRHCWGDALYIGGGKETAIGKYDNASRNVVVRNVVADDNRRLGLGVIHVDGLKVENCKFLNTGKSKSTPPSAGVDIEPNVNNGRNQSCKNIFFTDCEIGGCAGNAFGSWNSVTEGDVSNIEAVFFDSCTISGETGICLNEITFKNCNLEDVRMVVYSSSINVMMIECNLRPGEFNYESTPRIKGSKGKMYLKMEKCLIDLTNFNTRINDIDPLLFAEFKLGGCNVIIPESQRKNAERIKTKMIHHMSNTKIEYAVQ